MQILQARTAHGDEFMEKLVYSVLEDDSYDVLITGNAKVFGPSGDMLCCLVKGGLRGTGQAAWADLYFMRKMLSDNRPGYTGLPIEKHGKQNRAPEVASAIAGYFGRTGRYPFGRQTAFTANHPDRWERIVPMVQQVAKVYAQHGGKRYRDHMAEAKKAHPAWLIDGTPFSTVTVNNDVRAAVHTDSGDLKSGMGCLTVTSRGTYEGHYLCLPRYRIAVDVRDDDVLLFNPHLAHANTPKKHEDPDDPAHRISAVYYLRADILELGSPAEEQQRAKHLRKWD